MPVNTIDFFEKVYTNASSTSILQISKKCYDEYTNQISPKNSHIYIRACDSESLFHYIYPMTG